MIAASGLTKFYGDKCAVEDLSFDIEKGEIVGILGLNGAGKTTVLQILSCLLLPSSGTVKVDGVDVVEHPHEIRKKVGFLPDVPPLYSEMTVEGFLTFSGQLHGMEREHTTRRLDEVLETTHTSDVRSEIIGNLSHGYKQRVGIAQAVIHAPSVLILDEPISGLDPKQIKEMREMVRNLGGKHTIILSSHILSEISQTCDRILVLHDGKLIASGTEEELSARGAGQRLQITLRGDQEKAVELVRNIDGVTGYTVQGHAEGAPFRGGPEGVVHHLEVETQKDVREVLARELVQAGFGLLRLNAEAVLESAFLQLTQTSAELKAAGGQGGSKSKPDSASGSTESKSDKADEEEG